MPTKDCIDGDGFLPDIRRVAIIGAGPTGIAFAKYLLAEKIFEVIDIYEQRTNVGGIWNLSTNKQSRQIPVPQTDPNHGVGGQHTSNCLEFESPLYDYLETNIPKPLMSYSDFDFDESLPLYPRHNDVLAYLEQYAKPIRHLIQFQTRVVSVQPSIQKHQLPLQQKWNLSLRCLVSDRIREEQYDAVVVANGHYTVPHIPAIPGISKWNEKFPNAIQHSKAYRRPEDFTNQKVLVIGNSASGLDIAAQLAPHTQQPVYLASRSASRLAVSETSPPWREDVSEVSKFLADSDVADRSVQTKDGQILEGIDAVIFATGYFFSFPFLTSTCSAPGSKADSPRESLNSTSARTSDPAQPFVNLINSGLRTHSVYKHFIHMEYPTLALPLLNLKVIPFPLAENQAAVMARLWSGRLDLPSIDEMQQWERDEEARLLKANRLRAVPNNLNGTCDGINTQDDADCLYEGGFHTLQFPEDVNQLNSLHTWASSARKRDGLANGGVGKLGVRRDKYSVWLRKHFADIKAAYTKHGENRFNLTTLGMLGDEWPDGYDKWLRNTSQVDKEDLWRRARV